MSAYEALLEDMKTKFEEFMKIAEQIKNEPSIDNAKNYCIKAKGLAGLLEGTFRIYKYLAPSYIRYGKKDNK